VDVAPPSVRRRDSDPKTGKQSVREVRSRHINRDTDMTDLTAKDKFGKTTTIHTPQYHRFWDDTHEKWVEAANLSRATRLCAEKGGIAIVMAARSFTAAQIMRDPTVDRVHTYCVLAGATPVLVHNGGPGNDAVSIYRNVDVAEFDDMAETGKFRAGEGCSQPHPQPGDRPALSFYRSLR
jgi:hypothetical protein